jgi:hypothetical protein
VGATFSTAKDLHFIHHGSAHCLHTPANHYRNFLAKKPVLRSLAINALPRRFIAGFRDFIFAQIGKWVLLGE